MGIYYSFCNCRGDGFCPFLKTTAGHYAFDRLTLKLPLFGKLSVVLMLRALPVLYLF